MGRSPSMLALLAVACALAACAQACTKEEYTSKFGAMPTYTLEYGGAHDPAIEGDFLVVTVSYESKCPDGGSTFTALYKEHNSMQVAIAQRSEPSCGSPLFTPVTVTQTVAVELPEEMRAARPGSQRMVAFPPDSDYEVMLLEERVHTVDKPRSGAAAAAPRKLGPEGGAKKGDGSNANASDDCLSGDTACYTTDDDAPSADLAPLRAAATAQS